MSEMSAAALRPFAGGLDARAPVEVLLERVDALAHERQELRTAGAPVERLELNRLALVAAHRDLGHALIARHLISATA
jgi:hypothetical protein